LRISLGTSVSSRRSRTGSGANSVQPVAMSVSTKVCTSRPANCGPPGGLRALEEVFPGFSDELARAGAVPVRVAQEVQFELPKLGVMPKRDFAISLLCASRPLIEWGHAALSIL
jgi:hypothetical protein